MFQRICCKLLLPAALSLLAVRVPAQLVPQITSLNQAQLWQRSEFRITSLPATTNPFDPNTIRVDALFTLPSGKTMNIPAFWYQGYKRTLSGNTETLAPSGSPEWHIRFTPPAIGSYSLSVTVQTNNQFSATSAPFSFSVASNAPPSRSGYVRIAGSKQYFETGDGQPLRLIGENACWYGSRGTFDYDTWFPAMQSAGENYARIWMWPSAFGLEVTADSLTRYHLDTAWQLDYIMSLAEQRGIYLLLCLDFHGMFETTPDYWGGNNYWPTNPYNVTNGGPCITQNAFFTNSNARSTYQKRLRYLIARYGYSQNLLAWECFNEIDNEYAYLNPTDVANWHGVMGGWLHTNDPYAHLVTTSCTGSSDRPELWTVPQLDFAAYHSYGEVSPAQRLGQVTQSFLSRYRKPVMIGEFGTDWRGWNRTNDPSLRGFRQGIWGGALGGSVGTAMSWYWENLQSENVYPVYTALGAILNHTGWGRGSWTNIVFQTSPLPPATLGNLIPGGQPFTVTLPLSTVWGGLPAGLFALANPASANYAASTLESFVHGTAHPELRVPFRVNVNLTNNARLVMHVNSVSDGAVLAVRTGGNVIYQTNLANLDHAWNVNNEYNIDIPVPLPSGKQTVEIANTGLDWFYLDWVRFENVLTSEYTGGWTPSPSSIGLRGTHESLIYTVAPGAAFPAGATNSALPLLQRQTVTLSNWPSGTFFAEWYDPASGTNVAKTQSATTNRLLSLTLPDFREDLAAIVYPRPVLRANGYNPNNTFQFQLDSETGGRYQFYRSSDLITWKPISLTTNTVGTFRLTDSTLSTQNYYRATQIP